MSPNIAHLLGYTDPSHFARAFRRMAGVSPREYLQQHPTYRRMGKGTHSWHSWGQVLNLEINVHEEQQR